MLALKFSMCVCAWLLSLVWFFATPWTVTHQALLSMEFSRQEYWSRFSFPAPRDLPKPGDQTYVSCISCFGRQILYHCTTWEAPKFFRLRKSFSLLSLLGGFLFVCFCFCRWVLNFVKCFFCIYWINYGLSF